MIRERVLLYSVLWGIAVISSNVCSPAFAATSIDETPGRMTWGVGDHYTLPTDPDGWSIVEPGRMHRKIYAAADGTRDNSGLSPDTPVDLKTGIGMIREQSSDWLLLRRGDTFDRGISFGENMLGEIGGDALTSTLVIAGEDTSGEKTVLEIDSSQLRLPPGEHRLVLVNVDRLEGRFANEKISGVPSASVAEAKIVYDESAGEIRVHLISSEKNSQP